MRLKLLLPEVVPDRFVEPRLSASRLWRAAIGDVAGMSQAVARHGVR